MHGPLNVKYTINAGNTHNSTKHWTPENNSIIRSEIIEIKRTHAHL